MQKLAIFTGSDMRTFGGGEKYVAELANRLKGFDITIFSYRGKPPFRQTPQELSKFVKADIQYYNAPQIPLVKERFMLTSSGLSTLGKINHYDVVYCLDNSFFTNFILSLGSKVHKYRYILGIHDANILKDKPIVNTAARRLLLKIYSPLRNFGLMLAPNVRVINERDGSTLRKMGYKGNVYAITDFVNVKNASPKVNKSKFTVLFVGRLSIEHKGIDLLCEIIEKTLAKNKEIHFEIIGSGDNGEKIVKDLVNRHRNNVKWHGFVTESKLIDEYNDANLLVFPSRFESFGLSLAEGQAYGLPAVAFDVRGPDVVMKKDVQGKLVKPFDTDEFASNVEKYYKMWKEDSKSYLKMKQSISKSIIERFGEDRILPKVKDMLSER